MWSTDEEDESITKIKPEHEKYLIGKKLKTYHQLEKIGLFAEK